MASSSVSDRGGVGAMATAGAVTVSMAITILATHTVIPVGIPVADMRVDTVVGTTAAAGKPRGKLNRAAQSALFSGTPPIPRNSRNLLLVIALWRSEAH